MLGKDMIIVNSYDKALELFHGRGAIYSGRGSAVVATRMTGQHKFLSIMEGQEWKEYRRLFMQHGISSQSGLARFEPSTSASTGRFLCQIIDDPNPAKLLRYIRTYASISHSNIPNKYLT
jgi:cytochrome P450